MQKNVKLESVILKQKINLAKKILFNEWLNGTKIYVIDPERRNA